MHLPPILVEVFCVVLVHGITLDELLYDDLMLNAVTDRVGHVVIDIMNGLNGYILGLTGCKTQHENNKDR